MATNRTHRELITEPSVTLDEFTSSIIEMGDEITFIGRGEMGIGKSYTLNVLAAHFADTHEAIYLDMPLYDTSDMTGVPYTEEHTVQGKKIKITHFAPSALIGLQFNKPVLILADEIGKVPRPVMNTTLRLFHEHKIGSHTLPDGSRVFGLTNLAAEGLGDSIPEHAIGRVTSVWIRKPEAGFDATGVAMEGGWGYWAMQNGVLPLVVGWVRANPHALASFRDPGQENNRYIHHPGKTTGPCVSPRQLVNASNILKKRGRVTDNALFANLAGTIGHAAALDMWNYMEVADKQPTWEAIVASPHTAPVPSGAALFMVVDSAIQRVTRQTMDPWMDYCARLPKEYQGVFALSIVKTANKEVALSNRKFVEAATANVWMF
jgi:hypothetical protein